MLVPRAVAVVVRDGRVLVIKRHWDSRDYAVLPGGGVEPGEAAPSAALRELYEETTMYAEIDRLLWKGLHDDRPASYFLMKHVEGEPVLSGPEAEEHCPTNSFELLWATPEDFDPLGLHPAGLRPLLSGLLNGF